MNIITCLSLKGGTGKTATALNTGAALRDLGKKVLFVDLDTQNSLAHTLGGSEEGTLAEFLQDPEAHSFTGCRYGHLLNRGTDPEEPADFMALSSALKKIRNKFDFCVIDTPPALSESTVSGIAAASGLVIPTRAEAFCLNSVSRLFGVLDELREAEGIRPDVLGILLTAYHERRTLDQETARQFRRLASRSGTKIFNTTIRDSVAMPESIAMRRSIFEYKKKAAIAEDFRQFTAELLNSIEEEGTTP